VLPWGQMSFWGATVITSLVTTVPVVGKQIVLWLWGGSQKEAYFCCETRNKTLLNAGKGFFVKKKVYYYVINLVESKMNQFQNNVKMYCTVTQSAGLTNSKRVKLLQSVNSQRLNAEDL
jgi:hypothetical protein